MKSSIPTYVKLAWGIILIYVIVAVLAPYLASTDKHICFGENCLLPIIDYKASTLNTDKKNIAPFTQEHILGTDILGRDTAAGLIHGARKSLLIGAASTLIGGIIGTILGMAAGYFKDDRLKSRLPSLLLWILLMVLAGFYTFIELVYTGSNIVAFVSTMLLSTTILWWLTHKLPYGKSISLPLDTMITKVIEIRKSIPSLFLILALIPVFKYASIWNIIIILSILVWSDFARFARAEVMNIREENYIKRAQMNGISNVNIMLRHIWPNIQATMVVVFCFTVAGCVLAESSISFLGLGLDASEVSWGSMLSEGRKTLVWWLIVFPGLAIFGLVWSLTSIAEYYRK